ncbi:putative polyketide biosynthesis zinc-dependent hydrolase BaeB [Arthrobacter sp. Bi83]|uniref:MBL fold metallo-hydrolase n=1 Tax=Arthrobacter sp. Bi83 TaxID=2822353 RepID=UPI001D7FC96D|nr:MBL fold metallo-hydrolase [Arthrobacter sp. Bi83]CAH0262230.1 putative polyketide biosynthesis zinc-dependent hydrolase BaeB [Arthrobacter sp. Bi83]
MDVVVIETPQLGDRSYLIHDGSVALVIDAQRDTDRIEDAARRAGVRITHVAETHVHNDYLTGGLILARTHGAKYLVNAEDSVAFERDPIADGQTVQIGGLSLRAVATPGHTHTHLSYIVTTPEGEQAVFSGGSLLYGSVGRTDLLGPADTVGLTRDQYASVRRLADEAGPRAGLFPTHGFGSFCSAGPSTGAGSSTIGEQLATNHALTDPDPEHFLAELMASLSAFPSYYAHMAPINLTGPGPADLSLPEPMDAGELAARLSNGEWVVDLRRRMAFASSHLRGSVSFEYGSGSSFSSYLGWVLPWGEKLTLVGSRDDLKNAVRDLSRIGIDGPDAAVGTEPDALAPGAPVASYPRAGWAAVVHEKPANEPVLDVRRTDEFAASHLAGAVNVPLHELLARLGELPAGKIWVHCATGYRAGVAASLLQRAGRDVVQIDARFRDAGPAGVALHKPSPH